MRGPEIPLNQSSPCWSVVNQARPNPVDAGLGLESKELTMIVGGATSPGRTGSHIQGRSVALSVA